MEAAGLKTERCSYIQRATINKKEGINVPRIFVQGKFVKVATSSVSYGCGIEELADSLSTNCSVNIDLVANSEDPTNGESNPDVNFKSLTIKGEDVR